MHLNGLLVGLKLLIPCDPTQQSIEIVAGLLVNSAALVANQHDGLVRGIGVATADKSIQAFDSVD